MLISDWTAITLSLTTHWRIVSRGSQIMWVTPHRICGSWLVQSPTPIIPCYAHEGD